jgi:diguanylate cyclase (GGDEF)-like protein
MTADDVDMLAILRASQAISSETSLRRLHAAAVEQLRTLTGADRVGLLLAGEDGRWQLLPEPGPFPSAVVRYVDRTGEPLTVSDAVRDDRFRDDPYLSTLERCALMAVPLTTQGAGRAMLVLENRLSAGAFAGDRLDAVMLIAGQLAVSLHNAVLYHTLEERVADRTAALRTANDKLAALSVTDELTGLPNRRRFTDVLDETWTGEHPDGRRVAVAMIDIDHFKRFNDRYGHPAGDACLRRVAQAMQATTRGSDTICRYGGEEFVMILPDTDVDRAVAVGERVRAAVAALAIPHSDNPGGVVSISVGVAAAAPAGTTAAELLAAADGALYEAKGAGRNRVRLAA